MALGTNRLRARWTFARGISILLLTGCGSASENSSAASDQPVLDPSVDASLVDASPTQQDGSLAVPDAGGEMETCGNGVDDNGNGSVDEGCTCNASSGPKSCYPGKASEIGVGQCKAGTQACVSQGEFWSWGTCSGFVLPAKEICGNDVDEDCDGQLDNGCPTPQKARSMSIGTNGTCVSGTCSVLACNAYQDIDGKVYLSAWGNFECGPHGGENCGYAKGTYTIARREATAGAQNKISTHFDYGTATCEMVGDPASGIVKSTIVDSRFPVGTDTNTGWGTCIMHAHACPAGWENKGQW